MVIDWCFAEENQIEPILNDEVNRAIGIQSRSVIRVIDRKEIADLPICGLQNLLDSVIRTVDSKTAVVMIIAVNQPHIVLVGNLHQLDKIPQITSKALNRSVCFEQFYLLLRDRAKSCLFPVMSADSLYSVFSCRGSTLEHLHQCEYW